MDGNLGKALKAILANLCVEYASKGEATLTDWLPQIEQAFRDAGWIEPQQPDAKEKLDAEVLMESHRQLWDVTAQLDEAQEENQELKLANACGAGVYEDMCDIIYTLQSWLDKISKPINLYTARARAEQFRGDYPATSQCLEALADYLDSQQPSETPQEFKSRHICKDDLVKVGIEKDCPTCKQQKSSEKPNHVHSDDSGIFWEGLESDCPFCKQPKAQANNGGT
jgi:hypothetical protein